MPQARPFNAVPPFGFGALNRINVTSAQAANYVNILSLEDAAKLYWNIGGFFLDAGFAQIDNECNPVITVGQTEIDYGNVSVPQPDERIPAAIQQTTNGKNPEETDDIQTVGRISFNVKPREIFNTETQEVIGYTLPSSNYSLPTMGPSEGASVSAVLMAAGGNCRLNHFLSSILLIGTFNPSAFTEIDETSDDQRTYRHVIQRPLTLMGVDLTAVVIREGFIDTAFATTLLLDDYFCVPDEVEDALTIVWDGGGPTQWTVGTFINTRQTSQGALDDVTEWTYNG